MAGQDTLDRLGLMTAPVGSAPSGLVTPPSRDTTEPLGEYYDTRYKWQQEVIDLTPSYYAIGSDLPPIHLRFNARGMIVDNLSGILLKLTGQGSMTMYIPASRLMYSRIFPTPSENITLTIVQGALPSNAPVIITFSEAPVIPTVGI